VHSRGARVYEVALGAVVAEATIEGPLPRGYREGPYEPRPATGGQLTGEGFQYERSQKSQRHHQRVVERNRSAAAEYVIQRFDQNPCHVVLVGPREVIAAFERALPWRIQERIIARRPEPPTNGAARPGAGASPAPPPAAVSARPVAVSSSNPGFAGPIVEDVLRCLAQKEKEQENETIEQALGQAKRGGNAVLGPDEVVLAVNERRVSRLILEDDFAGSGWMCRDCNAIGANHADRCTYCNGELGWVKEIGEELAARVMADDGQVEIVPHDRRLHAYRGVAAMLRQVRGGFGANEQGAPRS
jgi:hypothetical protein